MARSAAVRRTGEIKSDVPTAVPVGISFVDVVRFVLVTIGAVSSLICAYYVVLSFGNGDFVNRANKSNDSYQFKSIVWNNEIDVPRISGYDTHALWGTLRPGYYFGMKRMEHANDSGTLSSGLMWSDQSRKKWRHETKLDELSRFEWIRHDGQNYGRQILQDKELGVDLTTSFAILSPTDENRSSGWIQKIQQRSSSASNGQNTPLVVYFGADCADQSIRDVCFSETQFSQLEITQSSIDESKGTNVITIVGTSALTKWFSLSIVSRDDVPPSYVALHKDDVYSGTNKLSRPQNTSPRRRSTEGSLFDSVGDLSNDTSEMANFVAVKVASSEVFVVYREHLAATCAEDAVVESETFLSDVNAQWNSVELKYEQEFETRFQELVGESTSDSGASADMEAIRVSLSSLLGGLGQFEGVPRIDFKIKSELDLKHFEQLQKDVHESRASRTKLFTGTPSRTVFPRGFLWDEGFHQLVMSHWNLDITFHVISDWLNSMYLSPVPDGSSQLDLMGWIPREMILGQDSTSRVPEEFITQRATVANPPTFLLVVESLLSRLNQTCSDESSCFETESESSKIIKFVQDCYPRLHYWIQWFRYTQQGKHKHSFRWRGRSSDDQKVIPNTLASGLDDYPRGLLASDDERHVDLYCWMAKAYDIMQKIEYHLESSSANLPALTRSLLAQSHYREQAQTLVSELDSMHWSEQWKGYFDVGLMNESAMFVASVQFRCALADGDASQKGKAPSTIDIFVPIPMIQHQIPFCPESHPKPLYPMGDGQGGYIMRDSVVAEGFAVDTIPRVGYVSLFPLLLKLVSPASDKLADILAMMENPTLLYTPYGLRSISQKDTYYLRKNAAGDAPYWRGPIWINMNYLALSALKHYSVVEGPHRERCAVLYTRLRDAVLKNVLKEYFRTGFFWEQYDDQNGQGMRGHPFTGWTATIVSIFLERY